MKEEQCCQYDHPIGADNRTSLLSAPLARRSCWSWEEDGCVREAAGRSLFGSVCGSNIRDGKRCSASSHAWIHNARLELLWLVFLTVRQIQQVHNAWRWRCTSSSNKQVCIHFMKFKLSLCLSMAPWRRPFYLRGKKLQCPLDKNLGRCVNLTTWSSPASSAEVKERVKFYLHSSVRLEDVLFRHRNNFILYSFYADIN
jgi:hypothetical protein